MWHSVNGYAGKAWTFEKASWSVSAVCHLMMECLALPGMIRSRQEMVCLHRLENCFEGRRKRQSEHLYTGSAVAMLVFSYTLRLSTPSII